jgi:hypothetical protein
LGKLVQFEKRERTGEAGSKDAAQSADILIFTGVRYERSTPPAPTKPTASSSGNKRKRG